MKQDISSVQLYDANTADDIINSIRTMQSESRKLSKDNIYENSCIDEPTPSTSASTSEFASTSVPVSVSPSLISAPNSRNRKARKR